MSSINAKMKAEKRAMDENDQKLIQRTIDEGIETVWDRLEKQLPQCGYGSLGICCNRCLMGPCRIDPFEDGGPTKGVCGAGADLIVARNYMADLACGAAAHSDHGREVVEVLLATAEGKSDGYKIKDTEKLNSVAKEYGIEIKERSSEDVAKDVAIRMLEEFGTLKNSIQFMKRAPEKTQKMWNEAGIMPRGIDREVVDAMHRVHMGVGADYKNIILHCSRTSLSDGWGGSMMATECGDILFGTPKPIESTMNLAVLSKDKVNITLHGHNPVLAEMVLEAVKDPDLKKLAIERGAKGINLIGICCTGNELLMRHGIPLAGPMLDQELVIATGAIEADVVDYQCVFPSIVSTAKCFHTKIITTSEKMKIPGAVYQEFKPESALTTAKEIVRIAIENYPNRNHERVRIPEKPMRVVVGFSEESIKKMLGGSYKPLIDAIVSGKIRGAAAVVGCTNPKVKQDYGNITVEKELIKRNILVLATGCGAIGGGKAGLMVPEAAELAGDGLKSVCKALGIPPLLHMGSCVENARILVMAANIAKELGVGIEDLPLAGASPELYSEKGFSIAQYFVSSGIFTVSGVPLKIFGSQNVTDFMTNKLEDYVGATLTIEPDPIKAADLMEAAIEKKRKKLGI